MSDGGYEGIYTHRPPVVWDTETGGVVDLGLPDAYGWDWHPNSRWLAYLYNAFLIGISDMDEGRVVERVLAEARITAFGWSPDGTLFFVSEEDGSITVYRAK